MVFIYLVVLIYLNITIKKVWIPNEVAILNTKQTVELCAIYWHFLLAVWVVLIWINVIYLKERLMNGRNIINSRSYNTT